MKCKIYGAKSSYEKEMNEYRIAKKESLIENGFVMRSLNSIRGEPTSIYLIPHVNFDSPQWEASLIYLNTKGSSKQEYIKIKTIDFNPDIKAESVRIDNEHYNVLSEEYDLNKDCYKMYINYYFEEKYKKYNFDTFDSKLQNWKHEKETELLNEYRKLKSQPFWKRKEFDWNRILYYKEED